MNKNLLRMALICAVVTLCSVGGTWAYFTYSRMADNAFFVGTSVIEMKEDYEPPKTLTVGDNIFRKRVQVKNTGSVACFVRVFADFSDYRIKEISQISPDGSEYYPAEEYPMYLPGDWIYISTEENALLGGFYYYKPPLEAGKTTAALFEKIKCSFQSAEEIRAFDIIVSAESVQTYDKDGTEFTGDDAFIQAWTEYLERR